LKHLVRKILRIALVGGIAAAILCNPSAMSAEVVTEPLAPVLDTKVELAKTHGKMQWLDADTLAMGTFRTNISEYWQGKIVAYNTREKRSKELRDSAFLQCTLPSDGIVAVQLGNYEAEYYGSAAKNPIKPRSVFFRWKGDSDELIGEAAYPNADWNWFICRQVQLDHRQTPAMGFYSQGIRYLLPADGVLEWGNESRSAEGQPVSWTRTGQASKALDLSSDEIALVPQYLPFANLYLLSSGKVATGDSLLQTRGKMVKQFPLVAMRRNGEVIRTELTKDIYAQIDSFRSDGVTYLSAAGLIVATDSGLFVVEGKSVRRAWCSPAASRAQVCRLAALEISPDGCKIALAPTYGSVQIVNVCATGGS
jgi:hypothetical protein